MSKYCKNCGAKLNENEKYCKNCGVQVNENASQSNINNKSINKVDRTPEMILAIIGGVLGFINGIYAIYDGIFINQMSSAFSSFVNSVADGMGSGFEGLDTVLKPLISMGITEFIILGIIAIVGSIISIYVGFKIRDANVDADKCGSLLVIATILFIISFSTYSFACILCTLLATILTFVRE